MIMVYTDKERKEMAERQYEKYGALTRVLISFNGKIVGHVDEL